MPRERPDKDATLKYLEFAIDWMNVLKAGIDMSKKKKGNEHFRVQATKRSKSVSATRWGCFQTLASFRRLCPGVG